MKTVHLISGGDAGGARTHVLRLLGELNKTGEAHLLCLGGGVLADGARERGIPCETLTGGFFAQLRAAKRYIRSDGFDLVRCHGSRANLTAALLRPSLGVAAADEMYGFHGGPPMTADKFRSLLSCPAGADCGILTLI